MALTRLMGRTGILSSLGNTSGRHHTHHQKHQLHNVSHVTKVAGGSAVKTIIIVVAAVVVVAGGVIGAAADFLARPQPRISVSSKYTVGTSRQEQPGRSCISTGGSLPAIGRLPFCWMGRSRRARRARAVTPTAT